MGQKVSAPESTNGFWYESGGWGFESPSDRDNFCLRNVDAVRSSSICKSTVNADVRTQLAFQMLTLLRTYLYHQSQYSTTWGSKCLAPIAQMVWEFGITRKKPPQVETFYIWKTSELSIELQSQIAFYVNYTTKIVYNVIVSEQPH